MNGRDMMADSSWIKLHIEMDYDNLVLDGIEKQVAIRKIAKEWLMTHEEVNDIITIYEKEMNDIDHTGDLGEII